MALRLSVRNLTVTFQAPGGEPLPVLGPVSFDIQPGEFVCLVGPSGGGKSTLIRVLAGLQIPDRGEAWLGDEQIVRPSLRVGLMFQEPNLMPWRTVIDNVALALELGGMGREDRYRAASEMLSALGLQDFAYAFPAELSGGMAQRAALGRVLVQQPDVLLLDEPFGALDALTREKISFDLLRVRAQGQQTALMVTHSIQEAVLLSDRVFVMSQRPGRIAEEIVIDLPRPRQPEDEYTDTFMNLARRIRNAIDSA